MRHYPHHIGDFDKATRHLTRIERSVYRDLIELYYDTEKPLPLDVVYLCRKIIARTDEEVTAVQQALNEFFNETPDGWYHERCEAEIEAYRANMSQKAQAGRASAEARRQKRQHALNARSTGVGQPSNGTPTNQEPLTSNQEKSMSSEADESETKRSKPEPSRFAEFWSAYPRDEGKKPALTAWKAKKLDAIADQIIGDVKLRIAKHKPWREGFIPHATTYLRNERWNDAIDARPVAEPARNGASSREAPTLPSLDRLL